MVTGIGTPANPERSGFVAAGHFCAEQVLRRHTGLGFFSVSIIHLGKLDNEAIIKQTIKGLVDTCRGVCKVVGVKVFSSPHLRSSYRGEDMLW